MGMESKRSGRSGAVEEGESTVAEAILVVHRKGEEEGPREMGFLRVAREGESFYLLN